MSLNAYPINPRANASALLVFKGPPNVAVSWALAGYGSITPQSAHTDARGVAGAVFVPVSAGDVVTITVTHGTAA